MLCCVCVCVVTTKKDAIGDCEMLGDVLSRGVVVVSGVLSRRRTQQAQEREGGSRERKTSQGREGQVRKGREEGTVRCVQVPRPT